MRKTTLFKNFTSKICAHTQRIYMFMLIDLVLH